MKTLMAISCFVLLVGCSTTNIRNSDSYNTVDLSNNSSDISPPIDTSTQLNIDQENQNIQEMNATNAMNASMQAAEEQNEEANQAAQQTEINAGF